MTVTNYSESIIDLSKRVHNKQHFRLKLPGDSRIFYPKYNVTCFLQGDIVAFHAAQLNDSYFFIGIIKKVKTDARGQSYDIDCILRPKERDPERYVNWLPRARIERHAILCEIKEERKI